MPETLYPHVELDFTKLDTIPVSDIGEESLFALSMIPALGNQALEAACELTSKSTEAEVLAVKTSLYRQMVMLDNANEVQDAIYSGRSSDTQTFTSEYSKAGKDVDILVAKAEKGLELQKTLAHALRCCETSSFDELKGAVDRYKEAQKKQTDKDLTRTTIKVIGKDGKVIAIKGGGPEIIREELKKAGLNQNDINYLNNNLNQTTLTGNTMGVINAKNMEGEIAPYNGNCNEVIIRVGASGMESLAVHATVRELGQDGEGKRDAKVTTRLTFDSTKPGSRIPTSVKVEVEHEYLNNGIRKFKNIPLETKSTTLKKVKFFVKEVVTKVKEIAKKIKNILTGKGSKDAAVAYDYLIEPIAVEAETAKAVTPTKERPSTIKRPREPDDNASPNLPLAKVRRKEELGK
jgi:hypothetical protein